MKDQLHLFQPQDAGARRVYVRAGLTRLDRARARLWLAHIKASRKEDGVKKP